MTILKSNHSSHVILHTEIGRKFCLLFSSLSFFIPIFAPANLLFAYNTTGFPAAIVTPEEDLLIVSDAKSILRVDGRYTSIPIPRKALNVRASADYFSQSNHKKFLACLGDYAFLYNSISQKIQRKRFDSTNIQCAFDHRGNPGYYLKDKNTLHTFDHVYEDVPIMLKIEGFLDGFIGLTTQGKLLFFRDKTSTVLSTSRRISADVYSNFELRKNTLLLSTQSGIFLGIIPTRKKDSRLEVETNIEINLERLNVFPCEDEQVCGLSLGEDKSWAVSGYWGSFIGSGKLGTKLDLALLSRKNGGVALSHTKNGGKFVLVSSEDVDYGNLKELTLEPRKLDFASGKYGKNVVAWTKKDLKRENLETEYLELKNLHTFQIDYGDKKSLNITLAPLESVQSPSVIFWEPVRYFTADLPAPKDPAQRDCGLSSDPCEIEKVNLQDTPWWHDTLELSRLQSWLQETGNEGVRIGIVDSGINENHPAFEHLKAKWIAYDFVDEDEAPDDQNGHGSHVSGIIAGKNIGFLPNADLVISKVLNAKGQSNSFDLARGIYFAVENGAKILNFSWGGGYRTEVLKDAVKHARNQGVIMATSSGNGSLNVDEYPQVPAVFADMFVVSAYDEDLRKPRYANWGKLSVDFAAPGDEILSAHKEEGSYKILSGTSMAVAVASATLAIFSEDLSRSQAGPVSLKMLKEHTCLPPKGEWQRHTRCSPLKPLEIMEKNL